jgi:hypothetical protein
MYDDGVQVRKGGTLNKRGTMQPRNKEENPGKLGVMAGLLAGHGDGQT